MAPPNYPSRGTAEATASARWLLTVDDLPSVERDDRAVMNDAIGLSSSVIHNATLPILGMVRKVSHLVTIEEVSEETEVL